jgi:hypothetical protein
MTEFVMFQSGRDGITAAQAASSGHDARRDTVRSGQVVSFVIRDGRKIWRNVLANLFEIGLRERFDARRDCLIAQDQYRHVIFSRDIDGFDGDIETILNARRREHDAGRIAVAAKAGNVQVGLLDAGRHAGGRSAALNIANHQRDFRHDGPAERLGFE